VLCNTALGTEGNTWPTQAVEHSKWCSFLWLYDFRKLPTTHPA